LRRGRSGAAPSGGIRRKRLFRPTQFTGNRYYFQVNAEQLFDSCRNDIPALIETVKTMIGDSEYRAV
jgi:hypothetical protein